MGGFPHDEKENHEVRFKAKMIPNNECFSSVNKWLSQTAISKNDVGGEDDDVNPADSVSNVGSGHLQKSVNSSITSSVKLKAAAKRASVLARVKAVKERHAIEEEEEKLRKRKEMLALETELAESDMQMKMYNLNLECTSQTTNSVSSYYKKKTKAKGLKQSLDPSVKEFQPKNVMENLTTQQDNVNQTKQRKELKMASKENKPMDVRLKRTAATNQHSVGG